MSSDSGRLPTDKSSEPTVTVVVLVFNHAGYLRDAIDSILAQETSFEYQVLIGDDASTDGSDEIVREYEVAHPARIKALLRPRNVGMQANHRDLIERSQGRYIAFCEGDDYWTSSTKLQRQVDYLEAHPEASLVHSDFDRIRKRGRRWWAHRDVNLGRAVPVGDIFEPLLLRNYVQTCTAVVRRSVAVSLFESRLPAESYPIGDWPLALWASLHGTVDYIHESLASYRLVAGSATNRGTRRVIEMNRASSPMFEDFIELGRVNPDRANAVRRYHAESRMILEARSGSREGLLTARRCAAELPAATNRRRVSVVLVESGLPGAAVYSIGFRLVSWALPLLRYRATPRGPAEPWRYH